MLLKSFFKIQVRAESIANVQIQWAESSESTSDVGSQGQQQTTNPSTSQYQLIPNFDKFGMPSAESVAGSDMSLTSVDFSDLDAMKQ